jgi:tetratricopeptide (TPR) repeat protein
VLEWVKELLATGQADLIAQAKPQIQAALPQITDYELVLDLARKIYWGWKDPAWRSFASGIYQQGRQMALQAFDAAGNPSVAADILFKFCRRANNDFHDGNAILATWAQLSDVKKQWLWSESENYWFYLNYVLSAYRDATRYPEAEQFITPLLNDPATPPNGYVILANSYAEMKRRQNDWTTAFSIYAKMAQAAPTNEWTAAAYYWFALRAWKQRDAAQTNAFAEKILLALGKDCSLLWKQGLCAAALCFKAGLDVSQIPPQTEVPADQLQWRLKVIQTDLGRFNV